MLNDKKGVPAAKILWMQRFFAVVGNVAPRTMVNILVKLLFTPRRRTIKPSQEECLRQAAQFKIEVREFWKPEGRVKLSCYRWGKSDKKVLLVHGWEATSLDFFKMIPVLVENGYEVIAFDGPAHGSSQGERTHLVDFKEVTWQVIQQIGVPYAIIGHSLGGAAVVFMLMEHNIRVEKLVAIAIPTVSKRFFEMAFEYMKVPVRMQKAFFDEMAEKFNERLEKYNMIERRDPIKANDILVIYDEYDKIMNVKDTRDFLALHPEVKSINLPKVGHYSIIRNKETIEAVREFLDDGHKTQDTKHKT